MIARYTDHAANERTFLAWVRTSLALTALGCVLVKFELFMRLAGLPVRASHAASGAAASVLGLLFISVAVLTLLGAHARFRQVRLAIASPQPMPLPGSRLEGGLTALIAVLAVVLAVVLWWTDGHG